MLIKMTYEDPWEKKEYEPLEDAAPDVILKALVGPVEKIVVYTSEPAVYTYEKITS